MDAVPVTLGQEFSGYAAQIRLGARRVRNALPQVAQIPLGGTATGTGLNTHPKFAELVRAQLSEGSGLEILAPEDPFEAQGNRDALVELSGALKVIAVSLTKIANDIALMGSGPRAGIGELFLPELQKGSSIMPGKVNPVLPEVVLQVSAQVIGNDTAITIGGMQGQFELNVRIPLIARNLLGSIHLLTQRLDAVRREVRRRHRGQPRGLQALGRVDAGRGDRAEPAHRLRPGGRDRQGGRQLRPPPARGGHGARRRRGDLREGDGPAQDGARLGRPPRRREGVTRRFLVLQHDADAPAGLLAEWAAARGVALEVVRLDLGELVGEGIAAFDRVGHAGLRAGRRRRPRVLAARRAGDAARRRRGRRADPGHLLRRAVAGPRAGRRRAPRGAAGDRLGVAWARWTARSTTARGWSGTATRSCRPRGAEVLARNESGVQAFRLGPHVGLQFHPEVDEAIVDAWIAVAREDAAVPPRCAPRPPSCWPGRCASARSRCSTRCWAEAGGGTALRRRSR